MNNNLTINTNSMNNKIGIAKLPLIIKKSGFFYTQVRRGRRSFIYEQMFLDSNKKYYEVFKLKIRQSREVYGKLYPTSEIYPHDEAFGSWAWACGDLDSAKKRFNKIEGIEYQEVINENTSGISTALHFGNQLLLQL